MSMSPNFQPIGSNSPHSCLIVVWKKLNQKASTPALICRLCCLIRALGFSISVDGINDVFTLTWLGMYRCPLGHPLRGLVFCLGCLELRGLAVVATFVAPMEIAALLRRACFKGLCGRVVYVMVTVEAFCGLSSLMSS